MIWGIVMWNLLYTFPCRIPVAMLSVYCICELLLLYFSLILLYIYVRLHGRACGLKAVKNLNLNLLWDMGQVHCGICEAGLFICITIHTISLPSWYCSDVIMTTMASQFTSPTVVYSIVYSDANKKNHQSSASLAFVRAIDRWIPGEFPAQRVSNAANVSIWWRHHGLSINHWGIIQELRSVWFQVSTGNLKLITSRIGIWRSCVLKENVTVFG